MSLFGTTYPKLSTTDLTPVYLDLPYSNVEPTFAEDQAIEQQAVDGSRDFVFITGNEHASLKIEVNLWKYGDLTARRNKFKEIYGFNHSDVYVWVNSDGASLRDKDGNPAKFTVVKIDLYWKSKPQMFDTAMIYLKSKVPVDLDNQL